MADRSSVSPSEREQGGRPNDFVCPACGHMKDTPMHELGCVDKRVLICPVSDDPSEWEHFHG